MGTYTIRRATRSKLENPVLVHHGTQILAIDGQPGAYIWHDLEGVRHQIDQPILDFGVDGKVWLKTLQEFACGLEVTWEQPVTVSAEVFTERYQRVLRDMRPYSVGVRDCESTADLLLEGAAQHRQAVRWAVGALAGVLLLVALRD